MVKYVSTKFPLCHHFQKNYWKNGKNSIEYQSNYEKKYGRGFS